MKIVFKKIIMTISVFTFLLSIGTTVMASKNEQQTTPFDLTRYECTGKTSNRTELGNLSYVYRYHANISTGLNKGTHLCYTYNYNTGALTSYCKYGGQQAAKTAVEPKFSLMPIPETENSLIPIPEAKIIFL